MESFRVASSAFHDGEPIPSRHSCEGEDRSPPLTWEDAPQAARSLALILDDPDAPSGTYTHWVAWGLDPASGGIGEGEPAPREGRNSFGETGYRGPCPPPGDGPHRYYFRLFALDSEPELAPGAGRDELEAAIQGRVLDSAELMGTYER
jgi:Raf kinase inhibitor-like YbhB/YbcL family protein